MDEENITPNPSRAWEQSKENLRKYSAALLSLVLSFITTFLIISLGDIISLRWAASISLIIGVISFGLILSLKPFLEEYWIGKWKLIVGLTIIALATVPLSILLYIQQAEKQGLNNLIATQSIELTSQAENLIVAQAIQTSQAEDLMKAESSQTALFNNTSATLSAQVETIVAMQATIDFQATQIASPASTVEATSSEEEIKNVVRNYFELLSNNDLDVAWENHLAGSIKHRIVTEQGQPSWEVWWEARTVDIVEFTNLNFNFDKTDCWVYVSVIYNVRGVPEEYNLIIYLIWNEEQGAWLIDEYDEDRQE